MVRTRESVGRKKSHHAQTVGIIQVCLRKTTVFIAIVISS